MNKNVIALAVAGALALPAAASAAQVYGDKLEVYGKIHISLDYLDSGVSSSVANDSGGKLTDGSFSIASNSSRVGFKGKYQINDQFTALYQVEQEVNVDGSGNDNWTTRNSFVGLGGAFGKVLVGYHDTPFKSLGGEFLLFGDTAATWRAIVGACADCKSYTDANSATVAYGDDAFNNRVRNMIMYTGNFDAGQAGKFGVALQYSADRNASTHEPDNNDYGGLSASVHYKIVGLTLGLAYEHPNTGNSAQGKVDDIKATRFGAKYDFGKVIVGGLFEHITDDLPGGGSGALDRNAYGANVTYKLTGNTKLMAQVLKVGDYGNTNKTGATRFALGASQKVNSNLDFYAVYAQTNNDKNAAFPGTGHDHGDRLFTVAGKDPKAFSVGAHFKF